MPPTVTLDGFSLSIADVVAVARHGAPVAIAPHSLTAVTASRRTVEAAVARGDTIYGVNTGFGKLAHVRIKPEQTRELQLNLIRSHASGVGEPLPVDAVRAMMLLRANVLVRGTSGVRPALPELIVEMLNAQVHPRIPSQGSVGASGDLAPLAHLALAMIGEGADGAALRAGRLRPITLEAKEGLAFVNGTQAQTGMASLLTHDAWVLWRTAHAAAAMSLEAVRGTPEPFDARIHDARPHRLQQRSAALLRDLLAGSEIRESHRENDPRVQDAYSLRCMPQVHGAVRGALAHCEEILLIESASATDNPLVFTETNDVISGGNFHGAPLAFAFDYAAIAMADLMSMSERRTDRLVNPDKSEGLPAFLARRPGLESGFMIPHVAAASLVNEARVLAHPASVDNITTSGSKEDHVSMGMTSALKLRSIVDLAENLFAIELLTAAEALEHRRPLRAGKGVERAFGLVRRVAPPLTTDRPLSGDIAKLAEKIRAGAFDDL